MDLNAGRPVAARFAIRVEDLMQRVLRLIDGDQAVRPCGVTGRGLGRDGRADEVGNDFGQSPQPCPVDVD